MTNKYTAIPLIVYVPHDHPFITSRGVEYAESALLDHLQLIGLEPLIAEDFASTTIESDSANHELAARISAVCPAKPLSEIQTEPKGCPVMRDAAAFLAGSYAHLTASYEYPGYIEIDAHGLRFAFGDANGDFYSYNYGPLNDPGAPQQGGVSTISTDITAVELARFIDLQVALYEPASEPTQHPLYHRPITTLDQAKEILHDLYERGLSFHPDDNPLDCLAGQLPPADCLALARRINEAREIPGFDPCAYLVWCDQDEPKSQPEPDWSATLKQLRSALQSTLEELKHSAHIVNQDRSVIDEARTAIDNSEWVTHL